MFNRYNVTATLLLILVVIAIGIAGCDQTQPPVSPPATPTPGPAPTGRAEVSSVDPLAPTLVEGRPVDGSEVAMLAVAATADECSERPRIIDSRPAGHNSLTVLPRMGEGDYDKAQAFYKFQLSDQYGCQRAKPGEKYWDISALFFECGASIFQPQVYDLNGNKMTDVGILLFMNWPGAESFPYAVDPPYFQNGVAGFTENGNLGWAYGGESHIGPDGGPYNIWASSDPTGWTDRRVGSDAYLKAGWWDDHCEFSPMFQEVRKGGTEPKPTPTPGEGYELVDTDESGNETGRIPFQTGDEPSGSRLLKLQLDGADLGFVPWE